MSTKFNRETQGLRAKTQFVRGSLQKNKGQELSDEETAGLTDEAIADGITLGTFEPFDREPEAEAGDPPADPGTSAKSAKVKAA